MTRPPDRPARSRTAQRPSERHLARLVALARAANLWERLWRGLLPPLVVVGLFLCASWLGLWLAVPHWARAVGVALFAILLAVSGVGLWRLRPIGRREALRRIDGASGLGHRPATALDDSLAAAGRDPATDALWALHLRRAEAAVSRLRPGAPSPRAVDLDRFALRAGILVACLACALVAGPQRYARVAAAFDVGGLTVPEAGSRLDAWIDPPAYTGRAPVLLDLASREARDPAHPLRLAAPVGSVLIIRSSGDSPAEVDASGPLLPPPVKPVEGPAKDKDGTKAAEAKSLEDKPSEGRPAATETRLVLHGDAKLVLRQGGGLRGAFAIAAVPDLPPTIALREVPKANARGSLTLAYSVGDDYGVGSAEAVVSSPKLDGVPVAGPALVDPPRIQLALPGVTHGVGDADTTADLSDSPFAGAQVTMVLVARDEGGNEGRSEPFAITLPQKPFANPLARALVEQRRVLVLDPVRRPAVSAALDALMAEPDSFGTTKGVYLGLRYAADTLAQARTGPEVLAVADYLWGMALQIENGDLSDAERALRNAEKELRDAIERRAPDEEMQKLTQNLQAAMDRFLKELAEQGAKQDKEQADAGRPSKSISPRDLQKLIDRLKEQARSGNREEAKRALDELQDILENLKTAKRQKADPKSRAMAESLNQLDQMMRDQQELRDQTYKQMQGQSADNGQQADSDDEDAPRMPGQGQSGTGQSEQGRSGQGRGKQAQGGQSQGGGQQGGAGAQAGKGLDQRQGELRDRLAEVQKKLKGAGQGQGSLDDAGEAMGEATDALKGGDGSSGQAVDAQGRALDALQKGAKKLAEAMGQQGEGNGQASAEGEGQDGGQDGQATGDADPLGRPRGGPDTLHSSSRFDPLGVPAAQRAQRVLEELRRRLGDPARAQEEIDYLERLLRSY